MLAAIINRTIASEGRCFCLQTFHIESYLLPSDLRTFCCEWKIHDSKWNFPFEEKVESCVNRKSKWFFKQTLRSTVKLLSRKRIKMSFIYWAELEKEWKNWKEKNLRWKMERVRITKKYLQGKEENLICKFGSFYSIYKNRVVNNTFNRSGDENVFLIVPRLGNVLKKCNFLTETKLKCRISSDD